MKSRSEITMMIADDVFGQIYAALKESGADVLVCYLPVGSEDAAKYYAQCAIDAGVAFVNALPVFIAGTPEWQEADGTDHHAIGDGFARRLAVRSPQTTTHLERSATTPAGSHDPA